MSPEPVVDLTAGEELFVIGGVPRSGKTRLARALWNQEGIPGFGMDVMLASVNLMTGTRTAFDDSPERQARIIPVAALIAQEALRTHHRYALEGEALSPEAVAFLTGRFRVHSCFLVLHAPDLEMMERYETEGAWVFLMEPAQRKAFLDSIKARSQRIADMAGELGFPCIDMSAGAYEDRFREAMAVLTTTTPAQP